ncbi:MAG: hypothetical protein AB8H47_29665 [Bacteroidia bacterium]
MRGFFCGGVLLGVCSGLQAESTGELGLGRCAERLGCWAYAIRPYLLDA